MSANTYRVGGDHYKSEYQHWDLVQVVDLSYLEGCVTKYVVRWRKKNGRSDLQKALHFLNKLAETSDDFRTPRTTLLKFPEVVDEVLRFSRANRLSDLESALVRVLCTWQEIEELRGARQLLFALLDEAEAIEGPCPVPLSEENHHADRSAF